MKRQTRRRYPSTFKLEAIRLYEASGKSVRQIKMDLGIAVGLLNKWRAQQRLEGQASFRGSGHQSGIEAEVR